MKKYIVGALIAVVCLVTVLTATACDGTEVNESIAKPNISTVMANYDAKSTKRTNATADVSATMYSPAANGYTPVTLTETLELVRIINGNKLFAWGNLRTASVDDKLANLITTYLRQSDSKWGEYILEYLSKEADLKFRVGYKDGDYNVKADFNASDSVVSFWGATDDDNLQYMLEDMGVGMDIDLAQLLAVYSLLDLSDTSSWLNADSGDKYYSNSLSSFIYNLSVDSAKLYEIIFNAIGDIVSSFGYESYGNGLEVFNALLPYIKNWVTVGECNVDVRATKDKLPYTIDSSLAVSVNVNVIQLRDALEYIFQNDVPTDILHYIDIISALYCGVNGESNCVGVTFNIDIRESFSYDATSCSLDNVDGDLFLPLDEDTNGERYLFVAGSLNEPSYSPDEPDDETDGEEKSARVEEAEADVSRLEQSDEANSEASGLDNSEVNSEEGRLDNSEVNSEEGGLDNSEVNSEAGGLDNSEANSEEGAAPDFSEEANDGFTEASGGGEGEFAPNSDGHDYAPPKPRFKASGVPDGVWL